MSTLTPNYSLVKPDPTEVADVTVVNSNSDIIDTELKNREIESVTSHSRIRYSGTRWLDISRDGVDVEYVRAASTTDELIHILDQDLLDLAPVAIRKFSIYLSFEARRDSGSGDAFFDMEVDSYASEDASGIPGGSLISYCKRDEGGSFASLVDERAFDAQSEILANFGKVSSTAYRLHEFRFTALPANASDQISIDVEIKTQATALRIRNLQSSVVVEW